MECIRRSTGPLKSLRTLIVLFLIISIWPLASALSSQQAQGVIPNSELVPLTLYFWKIPEDFVPPGWENLGLANGGTLYNNVSYIETCNVQGQLFFGRNDWWHSDPWCGNRYGGVQWLKAANADYNLLFEDDAWEMPLDGVPWSPPDPDGRHPWNDTISYVLFEGTGCIRFYPHAVNSSPNGPPYELCYEAPQILTVTPTPTATVPNEEQMAICHHGRNGMEFLVAYSETDLANGIALDEVIRPPWDGPSDTWLNDGLKSCRLDGTWYLSPPEVPFSAVSHIRLVEDDRLLVCWDAVGGQCAGLQAEMLPGQPEGVVQGMIENAITPTRSRQIIAWTPTPTPIPTATATATSTPTPTPTATPTLEPVYLPLMVRNHRPCPPDPNEPNNTFATGWGPLQKDMPYTAAICPETDSSDWYWFTINTLNPISIDLTDLDPGTDFNLYVYYDNDDNPDTTPQYRWGEVKEGPDHLERTPTATGKYYVQVYRNPDPVYSSNIGSYTLKANFD